MISDCPGIRRVRRGKSFIYLRQSGKPVTDADELARIRALAIPPAWTDVWICPKPHGHLQATGRDSKGRKQYRYHARWRSVRDEAKYTDVLEFARHLPALRRQLERDMAQPRLTKEKVLATVVRLMERTRIRVGNDRYALTNGSYGLTTLLDQHAKIHGGVVEFSFRAKGGKPYRAALRDRRLATIVKRCRDIPGQRLFQYIDERGRYRPITSSDVNAYIRRATGHAFTAKSFRTWAGTLGAALLLWDCPAATSARESEKVIRTAIVKVSEQLSNTPTVCRKSYVHPGILDAYRTGTLDELMQAAFKARPTSGLTREESAMLALFEQLAAQARVGRSRARTQDSGPKKAVAETRAAPLATKGLARARGDVRGKSRLARAA